MSSNLLTLAATGNRRWVALFAAILLLLIGLTACEDESDTGRLGAAASPSNLPTDQPSDADAPDSADYQPIVGDCWDYDYADAAGGVSSDQPVDCTSEHTGYTFRAGTVSERSELATKESACLRDHAAELGLKNTEVGALLIGVVFWAPTSPEWAAGARWFRCDVASIGQSSLYPLPADIADLMDGDKLARGFAACLVEGRSALVPCTDPHDAQWSGSVTSPLKTPPQGERLLEIAEKPCLRITNSTDWFTTTTPDSFWQAGMRIINCWKVVS